MEIIKKGKDVIIGAAKAGKETGENTAKMAKMIVIKAKGNKNE